MSFLNTINNTWKKEEIDILVKNRNNTIDSIVDIFKKEGFLRSRDAIRRKRNKLFGKALEEKKEKAKTPVTLLIPDPHVTNDQDLSRFDSISNLIKTRKPDTIIIGGDLADMISLSAWEKSNKLAVEGRRYKKEIEAVNEALDRMFAFKNDIKDYNPKVIYLFGNHEYRVERYVESNPTVEGHMDLYIDLRLEKRGIEVVPYKKFTELYGVLFTHAPLNAAGMPISGKNCVHKASEITAKSLVFFHTHQCQEYSCLRHGDSELIQVYTAGCLFDGYAPGGYSDDTTHASMKCLSLLTHYKTGRFDIEQISLDRLYVEY